MIVFDLRCANGHTFEGWFQDRSAYRRQQRDGLIVCPVCNESRVEQLLSTFAIKSACPSEKTDGVDSGQPPAEPDPLAVTAKMAEIVEKHFDDVGSAFAKEALKIHYGISEPRNIRGKSSREEEKMLDKEGVPYFKVPLPSRPDSEG
jgi:hypothetical protein